MVVKADYSNVSNNIKFDDLVSKFEQKKGGQLRLKDSKDKNNVQMGTKEQNGGFWAKFSGRSNKFKKTEAFVLKRLEKHVGAKVSEKVKNSIKADQTSQDHPKTIGEMFLGVRDEWHTEVKEKYSSDEFVNQAIDNSTLDSSQKSTHRTEIKQRIQTAVNEKIASSPGKTLKDVEVKALAAKVVEDYALDLAIDGSDLGNSQKEMLRSGKWNNFDTKRDCSYRLQLKAVVKDAVAQEIKKTGTKSLPSTKIAEITNKVLTQFANVAAGKKDPPDVSNMSQHEAQQALQDHQEFLQKSPGERSALVARNLIVSNSNEMSGNAKMGQARLLFVAMTASENQQVGDGQPSWHESSAEVSKELIRQELGSDPNSLMRQGNAASAFNGTYLDHTASEYRDGIQDQYKQMVETELAPLQPFVYVDGGGNEQTVYDLEELSRVPPAPKFDFEQGSTNDLAKQKAIEAYKKSGVAAGKLLLSLVTSSYDAIPAGPKAFLSSIATVSDNLAVKSTVLNDSIALRLLSPKITFESKLGALGKNLDPQDPGDVKKRMLATNAYSGAVVFQNSTNNRNKILDSVWKTGPRWDMTKETLFSDGVKESLGDFYGNFTSQVIDGSELGDESDFDVVKDLDFATLGTGMNESLPPQPQVNFESVTVGRNSINTYLADSYNSGIQIDQSSYQEIQNAILKAEVLEVQGKSLEALSVIQDAHSMMLSAISTAIVNSED